MNQPSPNRAAVAVAAPRGRPRVGCLGAGWIGRSRLASLVATDLVEVVALVDPDPDARAAVARLLPRAEPCEGIDQLLARELDGLVIATPSAMHAAQAAAALHAGVGVFCQKPLALTAGETRALIAAAADGDRLLSVDLSYRHTEAAQALHRAVEDRQLGAVHAVELVFHNAYGPDKPWFTRRSLAGGGCLVDLGTHLLDLALWLTDAASMTVDTAHLTRAGVRFDPEGEEVEDFALVQLRTDDDIVVRIACSWFLPAGRDCVFEATVYGTDAAATMYNVDGSFYDFAAERHEGTRAVALVAPPDDWGGRAIAHWADGLAAGGEFDPRARELETLAEVIDDIYAAARCGS